MAITAITQVSKSTSTGSTISVPAGVQAGDILVLSDMAVSGSTPTKVVPSGFTEIADSDSQRRAILSWKLAAGSEGNTNLTGMNGSSSNRKLLLVFRPDGPVAGASHGGAVSNPATNNNPSAEIISASGGTPPLLVVGCYTSSGNFSNRIFEVSGSDVKDGEENGPSNNHWIAWRAYITNPQNVTIDMGDAGNSNCLQGGYIALVPGGGVTPIKAMHYRRLRI